MSSKARRVMMAHDLQALWVSRLVAEAAFKAVNRRGYWVSVSLWTLAFCLCLGIYTAAMWLLGGGCDVQ